MSQTGGGWGVAAGSHVVSGYATFSVQLQKANVPCGARLLLPWGPLSSTLHPPLNLEPLLFCPVSYSLPLPVSEWSSPTTPRVQVSRLCFLPKRPLLILGVRGPPGTHPSSPTPGQWDTIQCQPSSHLGVQECLRGILREPDLSPSALGVLCTPCTHHLHTQATLVRGTTPSTLMPASLLHHQLF